MAHQGEAITRNRSASYLSMISTIQSKPLYCNKDFLRQKYLAEGLSSRQIAREICSARSTVKEALKGFGIPLRPSEEARKLNKGQLGFGERMVNGKIVRHRAELRVLECMASRRQRGDSFDSIAAWLNNKGVPTKNRSVFWSRPTVYKILRRKKLLTQPVR